MGDHFRHHIQHAVHSGRSGGILDGKELHPLTFQDEHGGGRHFSAARFPDGLSFRAGLAAAESEAHVHERNDRGVAQVDRFAHDRFRGDHFLEFFK